jgi:ssDNA-binding Zn-finger/Zn-ribbon topoisomerase 1
MPRPGEEDPALDLPGAGETCPECGEGTLTGKRSRYGPFLGCSRYPDCKYIHRPEPDPATVKPDGAEPALEGVGETCPECGTGTLAAKRSRYGPFVGCSRYPDCRYIRKSSTGSATGGGRRRSGRRGARRRASPRA